MGLDDETTEGSDVGGPDDTDATDAADATAPVEAADSQVEAEDPQVEAELERLRLENEQLKAEVSDDLEARDRRRAYKRRSFTAVALLIVGSLLLPASVLTIWTRNMLLDTDRYVDTVQPLASDPTIQAALTNRISAKVAELVDVKSLAEEALPERAQILAAPIAAGANNLIDQATTRVIRSDQFAKAWTEANKVGHEGLVAALTGRNGDIISTENGKVVLKLGGVVKEVLDRVDDRFGLDIASKVPADKLNVEFVLVDSKQLADAQSAVRLLEKLAWLTIILAVGCLLASVLIMPDHRKGILRAGIGIIVGMLLLKLGFSLGRELYLTNLPTGVQRPDAAAIVFDTLTRFVLQAVRTIFAVGVVLLVGAWLTGPSAAAVKVRSGWDNVLGRGGSAAGSAVDLGPVPTWVARHLTGVRVAIVAIAALVVLWWDRPTGKVVLFIGLATLVPLAIAQLLSNAAHHDRDDVAGDAVAGSAGDDAAGDGSAGDPVEPLAPSEA